MARAGSPTRRAWIAGASGLVGRALLPLLLDGDRYAAVTALVRRPLGGLDAAEKLSVRCIDFAALPAALGKVDDAYIALGTTIKVAGSEAAFRAVDLDAVVAVARSARAAGATRLAVVSALGAAPDSRIFYNRVKGEMQEAVARLGYDSVVIAQPSLLIGDRAALGQPVRFGEAMAARLLGPVMRIVPRSVRPIAAADVAAALVAAMRAPVAGVRVLASGEMQGAADDAR